MLQSHGLQQDVEFKERGSMWDLQPDQLPFSNQVTPMSEILRALRRVSEKIPPYIHVPPVDLIYDLQVSR